MVRKLAGANAGLRGRRNACVGRILDVASEFPIGRKGVGVQGRRSNLRQHSRIVEYDLNEKSMVS